MCFSTLLCGKSPSTTTIRQPNCLDLLSLRKSNFVSVSKFQLPSHEKCISGSKYVVVLSLPPWNGKTVAKKGNVQNGGHHLVTVMLQQWVIQMSWDNKKEGTYSRVPNKRVDMNFGRLNPPILQFIGGSDPLNPPVLQVIGGSDPLTPSLL